MAKQEQIGVLFAQGWSRRRIARELELDRETVARYLRGAPSKPATLSTLGAGPPLMAPDALPRGTASGRPSKCEPFREYVKEKIEQGLSAQRIFQDLVAERGFAGSYSSVRRLARRLGAVSVLPFRRMECEPGAEAQIDFGSGAWLVSPDGQRRRTHVLRVTLSHSRKGYSEACLRQKAEDLIRCLENAFWSWGGVPRTLVIDNLKSAVRQADWYDPDVTPKLQAFCRHYGTVLLPCKSYMPRHKGKIERGIQYVKDNALKGRTFPSLQAQNEHLHVWEERIADQRIQGTTKRQVKAVFESADRPALLPLPVERFPFFQEEQRIAHRDAHVEVAKAYYSVPPEYVGRTLWVRWDQRRVRIFNLRWEEIALHARREPGRFSTNRNHLAAEKISSVERGAEALLRRAQRVGPQTARWAEAMLKNRGIEGVRVLVGLLALAKRQRSSDLESACETARLHGAYRLRTLRALLKRRSSESQQQLDFMTEHPLIRRMDDYGALVRVSFGPDRPWKEPALPWPSEKQITTGG